MAQIVRRDEKQGSLTCLLGLKQKAHRRAVQNMPIYKDLTGLRFGKLTAICLVEKDGKKHSYWKCVCDCGNIKIVESSNLRRGHTHSCGCIKRGRRATGCKKPLEIPNAPIRAICGGEYTRTKHPRLHGVWSDMKSRCQNPNNKRYYCYGERGVRVCDEWQKFAPFCKWALESGYDEEAKYGECTLDRVDVDGNYEPNNCRWVSIEVQNRNRRCNRRAVVV